MPADIVPAHNVPPLSRSERLSRDVLHALMIDPKPWVEIEAHRREVVRTTFEELEPQDEFEGMLASQMAIAHSIFLGTSWLSLDRERPERDRAYYLRQATRLMMLYRQNFNTLRQWRRERAHAAPYGPRRRWAFARPAVRPTGWEVTERRPEHAAALHKASCHRCAEQECAAAATGPAAPTFTAVERPPLHRSLLQSRQRRLMETASPAFAQGP